MRDFLNAAFALCVEAHVMLGSDVVTAVQNIEVTMGLRTVEEVRAEDPEYVPTAVDNDAALAEFQRTMAGL